MNKQPGLPRNDVKKDRIHYLDVLRFIAMLAVVCIHVVAPAWYAVPAESFAWKTLNFYDSLCRFTVPLFIAISGALFRPESPVDFRRLYFKKISRLAAAWVFWSFVYASRFLFTGVPAGRTAAFWNALYLGNYHLWFIPMMIGLYIITPLLSPILSDRKRTLYLLLLSFISAVLLPTLSLIPALSFLSTLNDTFCLYLPLGYVFYFSLGNFLHRETFSGRQRTLIYALGLLGVLATMLGTDALSHDLTHYEPLYGNFALNVALETAALFLLVKYACKKREGRIGARKLRFFATTTELTFGAYLSHEVFSIGVMHFGVTAALYNPLWFVPVLIVVITALGYLTSYCIHKFPILKDWVV